MKPFPLSLQASLWFIDSLKVGWETELQISFLWIQVPVWVQATNTLFTFKIILKIFLFDNKGKKGLNQVILNDLLDMSLQDQPDGGLPIMYWVFLFYCIAYHYISSFVFHSLGSVAISVRSFYPDTFHKAAVSYAWFCCDHFLLKRNCSFPLLQTRVCTTTD